MLQFLIRKVLVLVSFVAFVVDLYCMIFKVRILAGKYVSIKMSEGKIGREVSSGT